MVGGIPPSKRHKLVCVVCAICAIFVLCSVYAVCAAVLCRHLLPFCAVLVLRRVRKVRLYVPQIACLLQYSFLTYRIDVPHNPFHPDYSWVRKVGSEAVILVLQDVCRILLGVVPARDIFTRFRNLLCEHKKSSWHLVDIFGSERASDL